MVRDVQDGDATGCEPPDRPVQQRHLTWRHRGGGLVEDDEPRVVRECARDHDEAPVDQGETPGRLVERELVAERLDRLRGPAAQLARPEEPGCTRGLMAE